MSKQLQSILFTLFILLVSPKLFSGEYFVIDHYQVDVDVSENNVYQITEVIDVTFSQRRHGLFRSIPLRFDKGWVRIRDLRVPGHNVEVKTTNDRYDIRVGSVDSYVDGAVRYTFHYTYDVGADRLSDMDEFNHNVLGVSWDTTIAAADFTVHMPKPFDPTLVNCTSGPFGSTDNSKVEWEVDGTVIKGRLKAPLNHYEGLTVALPLPNGYWVGAKHHRKKGSLLFDLLGFPLYVIIVLFAFYKWFTLGRDNRLFPSVEWQIPEGMTPSEIGYVIDGCVDSKDVTALIIYWADQGLLSIEEEIIDGQKELCLIKHRELGKDAKRFEKMVFKDLFSFGSNDRVSTRELKYKFSTTISRAINSIEKHFVDNPDRAIFTKKSVNLKFFLGFLASLPLTSLLTEVLAPLKGMGPIVIMGFPMSFMMVIPAYYLGMVLSGQNSSGKKPLILSVLALAAVFCLFGYPIVFVVGISGYKFVAAVFSCVFVGILSSIMTKRTAYGDQILRKVLGFREFIRTAEKDRIQMMFESDPATYYHILPYATVMGLSDKWSQHFKVLEVQSPHWYRGYRRDRFDTVSFSRHFDSSFARINQSMTSAPPSSGSSGSSSSGGSSGGGSGGGGGGSW